MSREELRERLFRLTSRLNAPGKAVEKACKELENKLLPKLWEYEEKLALFVVNATVIPKPIRMPLL